MKKILIIVLLLNSYLIYSDGIDLPKFFYNKYKGKIGNREIVLELMKHDTIAGGFFYFVDNKKPNYISTNKSFINANNEISLNIVNEVDTNGNEILKYSLNGKFPTDKIIDGLCHSYDLKNKPERFVLSQDLTDDYARVDLESMAFISKKSFNQNQINFSLNLPILRNKESKEFKKINDTLKTLFLPYNSENENFKFNSLIDYLYSWYSTLIESNKEILDDSINQINLNWYYDINFFFELNEYKIISIGRVIEDYYGGLHPNSTTNYYNFDIEKEKIITLDDIFESDKIIFIRNIAEEKFFRMENLNLNQNLEEQGYWFKDGVFYLPDNFAIRPDGIKFIFNPYEVSSYARGIIEIFLSYDEIKNYIKKDSKIIKLAY